jgi:rhamnulokinase
VNTLNLAAVDLGAESGRVMRAEFDGRRIDLQEAHRFANVPLRVAGSLRWDARRLFGEIKHGLAACARMGTLDGLGLDTWGVDFGLLDRAGALLDEPYHYRDGRTDGMMARAFDRVAREEIFERTGIQFVQFNTLYQLLALAEAQPALLAQAQVLLTMPDLFNYWLSGQSAAEFTIATTTQMYDQRAGDWARDLLERLALPTHLLPPVVPPGTVLGPLQPDVASEIGAGSVPVIAAACHDTAAAVVAVPAQGGPYAYISSGTWSLVGIEVDCPVITPQSLAGNFTNEGGVGGTVRLLRNVMGLWLLQECRRVWAAQGDALTYDALSQMAATAPPFAALVDPDAAEFLPPGDMPARLRAFCARSGQPPPETPAALARCIFESLALKYRWTIERLEALAGQRLGVIHVVGGGALNQRLCQWTADATGRAVIAGPVEATALGNALVQAMALGHVGSLAEARAIVRASVTLETYEPGETGPSDQAYERFVGLLGTY